jgi:hypothetical protein
MDADKPIRPEPWPTLLQEGRTVVAADIVRPAHLVFVEADLPRYTIQI